MWDRASHLFGLLHHTQQYICESLGNSHSYGQHWGFFHEWWRVCVEANDLECCPGYYQVWHCIMQFLALERIIKSHTLTPRFISYFPPLQRVDWSTVGRVQLVWRKSLQGRCRPGATRRPYVHLVCRRSCLPSVVHASWQLHNLPPPLLPLGLPLVSSAIINVDQDVDEPWYVRCFWILSSGSVHHHHWTNNRSIDLFSVQASGSHRTWWKGSQHYHGPGRPCLIRIPFRAAWRKLFSLTLCVAHLQTISFWRRSPLRYAATFSIEGPIYG